MKCDRPSMSRNTHPTGLKASGATGHHAFGLLRPDHTILKRRQPGVLTRPTRGGGGVHRCVHGPAKKINHAPPRHPAKPSQALMHQLVSWCVISVVVCHACCVLCDATPWLQPDRGEGRAQHGTAQPSAARCRRGRRTHTPPPRPSVFAQLALIQVTTADAKCAKALAGMQPPAVRRSRGRQGREGRVPAGQDPPLLMTRSIEVLPAEARAHGAAASCAAAGTQRRAGRRAMAGQGASPRFCHCCCRRRRGSLDVPPQKMRCRPHPQDMTGGAGGRHQVVVGW